MYLGQGHRLRGLTWFPLRTEDGKLNVEQFFDGEELKILLMIRG